MGNKNAVTAVNQDIIIRIWDLLCYHIVINFQKSNYNQILISYGDRLQYEVQQTPFYDMFLTSESTLLANPYRVALETIDRIKTSPQYWQSRQWY